MAEATAESTSWASAIYRAIFGKAEEPIRTPTPKPTPAPVPAPQPRPFRMFISDFKDLAPYEYEPLSGDRNIRLVAIQPGELSDPMVCTITETSFGSNSSDFDEFAALSYTWGEHRKTYSISCNGRRLDITENLFSALRHFRMPDKPVAFWIDQVCINQADLAERASQVQLMRSIYQRAMIVVVWLGDEYDYSRDAFGLAYRVLDAPEVRHGRPVAPQRRGYGSDVLVLREYDASVLHPSDYERAGLPKETHLDWRALRDLFRRPWFGRIWTLQEIVLAETAMVVCGDDAMRWTELMRVANRVADVLPSRWVGVNPNADGLPMHRIQAIKDLVTLKDYKSKVSYRDEDLGRNDSLGLLIQNRNCKTGDKRDKIYGMLGLADYGIVPDYTKSAEDLFVEYAVKHIQFAMERRPEEETDSDRDAGKILTLVLAAGRLNQELELPSWVPDWSIDFRTRPTWPVKMDKDPNCYPIDSNVKVLLGNRLQIPTKVWTTIREAGRIKFELATHWHHLHRDNMIEYWFEEANRIASLVKDEPYPEQDDSDSKYQTARKQQARAFERTLRLNDTPREIRVGRCTELTEYGLEEKDLTVFLGRWSYWRNECHRLRDKSLYKEAVLNAQNRVFYLTTTGHMGMAPWGVRAGDIVAFLHPCIPVILRRDGEEYILLGVCTATATESIATKGIPITWITLK